MEYVKERDYDEHKNKCSDSFTKINDNLESLNRAIFGDKELKRKGVLDMTQEMYDSVKMAKGGERVFWAAARIAGGFVTLIAAFWGGIEFVKKVILPLFR